VEIRELIYNDLKISFWKNVECEYPSTDWFQSNSGNQAMNIPVKFFESGIKVLN